MDLVNTINNKSLDLSKPLAYFTENMQLTYNR